MSEKCKQCSNERLPNHKMCEKCRSQRLAYMVIYRDKNRAKINGYQKDFRLKNLDKCKSSKKISQRQWRDKLREGCAGVRACLSILLSGIRKQGARARIVPVSIDLDYLCELWKEQDGKCAISKLQMDLARKRLRSASIDRIKSDGDYTVGNVQLVCRWVNLGKSNHSDEELIEAIIEAGEILSGQPHSLRQ